MKVVAVILVVAVLISGCLPTLPLLPTPTATPDRGVVVAVGNSVGIVNIRSIWGSSTGTYFRPEQRVEVYAIEGDWCFVDRNLTRKVWCGCIGLGTFTCRKGQ